MKKLKEFKKKEIERLYEIIGNGCHHLENDKITYHFNSIRIIEAYGNIFDFDTRDYEVFLNDENDFWLEGKKVFTDSEDKNILLKIENNLYKLLELKF